MQVRNLVRCFVFNRALYSFAKDAGYSLKGMDVNVLLSLWLLDDVKGIGVTALLAYLRRFSRSMSAEQLIDILRRCGGVGLVESNKGRYKLTLAGKNAILALEKKCRETRWDR